MSKFEYSVAIDAIMMIMCVLLVISAAVNEHIYDSAATFKRPTGSLNNAPMLIGMNVDNANYLSNVVTILGSTALGMYALSLAQKKGKGSSGASESNKAPDITTAVIGFSVAVALIISGVVSSGIYDEIETFKAGKQEKAKTSKDMSYAFITLGAVVPVLYIIKFAWQKRAPVTSFLQNRFSGGSRGFGGGGRSNAASVFFSY